MAGGASFAELVADAYGQARVPVGALVKFGFYLVEVVQAVAVQLVAEGLRHGELREEVPPLAQLVLDSYAHRQRRRYGRAAARRRHAHAQAQRQVGREAAQTLVGLAYAVGQEVELVAQVQGVDRRGEFQLLAVGQHVGHVGCVAAEARHGEHAAESHAHVGDIAHLHVRRKARMAEHRRRCVAQIAVHAQRAAEVKSVGRFLGGCCAGRAECGDGYEQYAA